MFQCAISLGGNVGDVPSTFAEAVRLLEATGHVAGLKISRVYRTVPMGIAAGDPFQNAAAVFETALVPLDLLDLLQDIEHRCGRVRTMHWGPRTLDLDLLLYGDEVIDSPRLTIPHPAMWYRRFVLDPLLELMPEAVHPAFQRTIRSLRSRLLVRPFTVCVVDHSADSLQWVEAVMSVERPFAILADPAIHWLPDDARSIETAVVVFAGPNFSPPLPQVIALPDNIEDSLQIMNDAFIAALDEPVVESDS